jgi:hypothetical protein
MRTQERGIGNMPFIAVIVLLVAAIGLFFMKSNEVSTLLADLAKKNATLSNNVIVLDNAAKAYDAWVEVSGLAVANDKGESVLRRNGETYPSAKVIHDTVADWLVAQATEITGKSTAKIKARQFQVDKSSNVVKVAETGDTTSITLFGSPLVKETITFAGFVTPLAEEFRYAAKAIEDNNTNFENEAKSYQTRVTQIQTAANDAASKFQTDIASKAQLYDTEKTRADQMQDAVNQATTRIDTLQSDNQNLKTTYDKKIRDLNMKIQAQTDYIRSTKDKIEIAMKEDPSDGEILVADARQGLVFLNRGKNFRVAPGMRFTVWRVGKGQVRENVAEVEVIDVSETSSTARITKLLNPRVPVAQGMNFSNPFYDPYKKLRVYIYGNLRYYPSDLAKRRLAESGCTVVDHLDDTVNVVILGTPAVDISAESGSPEEAAAAEEKAKAERAARIREIMNEAATLGAVVVSEDVLQTFIQY